MDNPSFSWHPISADDFLLETADDGLPTSLERLITHTLPLLLKLFRYLVADLGWDLERIHLFGWGQGGSTVLELARYIGLNGLGEGDQTNSSQSTRINAKRLGSATSICGPLLSGLSVNQTLNISTPVLYFSRIATKTTESKTQKSFLQRTFNPETITVIAGRSMGKGDARMLQGADEWGPVMKFWSGVLRRGDEQEWMRQASKGGDVYEVVP
ncbi:hypothetical protein QFC22_004341 [Naganishia vaughanmartiniae]|uniref:Uncharacterized protein n=1 Tax=Naganishia vaughanmartiniae TaxID=1424756 RepID=A0ACC2X362_9TREE|nr:hypothetical protein QFC22_004341 [Naganishia vaughanmartiniae]